VTKSQTQAQGQVTKSQTWIGEEETGEAGSDPEEEENLNFCVKLKLKLKKF
jgi:hypothetical protein